MTSGEKKKTDKGDSITRDEETREQKSYRIMNKHVKRGGTSERDGESPDSRTDSVKRGTTVLQGERR